MLKMSFFREVFAYIAKVLNLFQSVQCIFESFKV